MDKAQSAGKALIDSKKILEQAGLARGMRLADLGCGRTGHFVFPAAKIVEDIGLVYAVDILKEVLDTIRSRVRTGGYDNIQTVWSDIEATGKTSIPAGTLDMTLMVNVFHSLKNKSGALEEAARLLKVNGRLVLIDWAKKLGALGPDNESMATVAEATSLAESSGLVLVNNFAAGDYHFCLVFRKV